MILGMSVVALLPQLPGPGFRFAMLLLTATVWLRRGALVQLCAGFALGLLVAATHGDRLLNTRIVKPCEMQRLAIEGIVASIPRRSALPEGRQRQRFEFKIDDIGRVECLGPEKVLLTYYGEEPLYVGERWRFDVRLKRPWGLVNPGTFNMQSWYAQTAIDAVGTVRASSARRLGLDVSFRWLHHTVRQEISARIEALPITPRASGILRALTVADRSGLDTRFWRLMQSFGINHLLVISGLHIGLVATMGLALGRIASRCCAFVGWYRVVPALPAVSALIFALGYCALAGFTLAAARAVLMLCCFVIASLLVRSSSGWNALLLAAWLLLVLNPLEILGSGFWLSFGAVACLLWLGSWRPRAGMLQQLFGVHLFMWLAMLPLGAWWFGGVSVVAGLANMLLLPLIGFYVVPLSLLAVAWYLVAPHSDGVIWQLAAWPLEMLLPYADSVKAQFGSQLFMPLNAGLAEVLLGMVALGLLVLPGGYKTKALAVLLMLPLGLPMPPVPLPRDARAVVTVLDVGQGTAVVVRDANHTLLYDTGGGDPMGENSAQWVVLPWLAQMGLRKLDLLMISHPDTDHSAGVRAILDALPVISVLWGAPVSGIHLGEQCRSGKSWQWSESVRFQILAPGRESGLSSNNHSCVLLVSVGEHKFLLPGDIHADREKELSRYWGPTLRANWLLAAHHGSQTSSSLTWLKKVQPALTVYSAGYASRFGHPHPTVVERISEIGSAQYNTATDGAITFEIYDWGISVYRARSRWPRYWM